LDQDKLDVDKTETANLVTLPLFLYCTKVKPLILNDMVSIIPFDRQKAEKFLPCSYKRSETALGLVHRNNGIMNFICGPVRVQNGKKGRDSGTYLCIAV
jgi:hypothetical protein